MKVTTFVLGVLLAAAVVFAQPAAPQPVNPQAAQPASSPEALQLNSVWDFVVKGGPTMVAIGLCSFIALTVIVERLIVLRRRRVVSPQLLATLKAVGADQEKAIQLCDSDDSAIAPVLKAIVRNRGRARDVMESAVRDAGSHAVVRLRRRMRLLSALPQVSTMLGLLGTIFGMIKTFQAVAVSGQTLGKTEVLARGIFEAWTNTAAGLLVAIPVLIAFHVLMGRIDDAAVALDRTAGEWLEWERESLSKAHAVSAAPSVRHQEVSVVPEPRPQVAPALALAAT